MNEIMALFLTLLAGCFFGIGIIINNYIKEKEKLINFSIGLSFIVVIGLIIFDLIPELLELFLNQSINNRLILILVFIILGISLLKIIDFFIPHHSHEEEVKNKTHDNHLYHIGVVTGVSILLHNLLEGVLIYNTAVNLMNRGIILTIGVAFHNIPMGIQIFSSLKKGKMSIIMAILLVVSGLLGAFLILVLGNYINDFALGCLSAITVGMLIYIALFELFEEIWHNIKKKYIVFGIISGTIIVLLSLMF